jgi:hypothetical protein
MDADQATWSFHFVLERVPGTRVNVAPSSLPTRPHGLWDQIAMMLRVAP